MTKTTRTALIIALVGLLLAGAACTYLLLNIISKGDQLRVQIDALAAQNEQAAALLRLQRLAQETAAPREELESYFLLRESDSIAFLTEIETLAPKVGLALKTQSLKQVTHDGANWIEVTFTVTGQRTDVDNFVQILEIIPYVSQIQSVTMNGRSPQAWEATITIYVHLLSYDS